MRGARLFGALGTLGAFGALAVPSVAGADSFTPIRMTLHLPALARADRSFPVQMTLDADAGALDARAGAIRAQVRLTTGECGGVFAATTGPVALDRAFDPQPSPGRAFSGSVRGSVHVRSYGTYTVCAYLDDDYQQLATSTGGTTVTISRPCTRAASAYDRAVRSRRVSRSHRAALRRIARRACGGGVTL